MFCKYLFNSVESNYIYYCLSLKAKEIVMSMMFEYSIKNSADDPIDGWTNHCVY